jgi:hypothetical protein
MALTRPLPVSAKTQMQVLVPGLRKSGIRASLFDLEFMEMTLPVLDVAQGTTRIL